MNIYFAGSINGGRQKREDYLELINYCKNFGTVLTEHIANDNVQIDGGILYSDRLEEHVYIRDVKWIDQSDVIIAEVTVPSLGVGYEIGYGESHGKKILCLYLNTAEKKLSFMIDGNNHLNVKKYSSLEEAKNIIKDFFNNISKN